jgi:hypothetical protein
MNRDRILAWHVNRLWLLAWHGKFPTLREELEPGTQPPTRDRMTGRQVASTLHLLAAQYGLTVTKGPRPTIQ